MVFFISVTHLSKICYIKGNDDFCETTSLEEQGETI